VTVLELVQSLSVPCQKNIEGRHVLAVSDSSEINWPSHARRLKPEQLGVVDNKQYRCGFLYTSYISFGCGKWLAIRVKHGATVESRFRS